MPKASINKDFNDFVKCYLKKEMLSNLPKNNDFKESDLQIIFIKHKDNSCTISFKVKNDIYEMNHLNYIFEEVYKNNNLEKMKNIFLNDFRIHFKYDIIKDILFITYKKQIHEWRFENIHSELKDSLHEIYISHVEKLISRKLTAYEKDCFMEQFNLMKEVSFLNVSNLNKSFEKAQDIIFSNKIYH